MRADCLTSIHYLFRDRIDLLLDWIGNMPRLLSKERSWKCLTISPDDLLPGDLLFLKRPYSRRLVTHVAMALSPNTVFHCSHEKKGAAIERIEELFATYCQPPDAQAMLDYVDHRSRA